MSQIDNLLGEIDSLIKPERQAPHIKFYLESYSEILSKLINKYVKKKKLTETIIKQTLVIDWKSFVTDFKELGKEEGLVNFDKKILFELFKKIKRNPLWSYKTDSNDPFSEMKECLLYKDDDHVKICY